ncbi:helix-turn-helix transcriptional regulator, partial [Salmonella enterica subsp. enterica serovar Heidelberg]|uniref:TetR/AcrR family transcriptional regulator n=1 Tax=Salmonella enterica TaxID=28901 RepID=UPI0021A417C2
MARPKSEDKKQALLEAATQAIAQSGIAASTAVIARNAGVAEGTLFRYFATKDELIGNDSNLLIVFYVQIMPDD